MMKKFTHLVTLALVIMISAITNKANAQDPYIGEIRIFAGTYAPSGWAKCEGQLLPILQNQSLFAIIGTYYGGNGTTNFALPDLRGRLPMGQGSGPGLTPTLIAEQQGTETVTLTSANLPSHNHLLSVYNGSGTVDSISAANPNPSLALVQNADLSRANAFSTNAPNTTLNTTTISSTGSAASVPNKQPTLTITYIIALQGIFPTQ